MSVRAISQEAEGYPPRSLQQGFPMEETLAGLCVPMLNLSLQGGLRASSLIEKRKDRSLPT